MVGNVAGMGYLNPFGNSYYNRVGLSTFCDDDVCFGNGMGTFNMMPYGCYGNGENGIANYYQYMTDNLGYMTDYQVQMQQGYRGMDLAVNAPMEGIQRAAAILNEKIAADEQDQIGGALENYINAVRAAYPEGANEQDISNRASTLYAQIYGTSLIDAIREKGDNSFKHGILKGVTFGLYNGKSAEENISRITGQPVGEKEQMRETAGLFVGGATATGIGVFLLKHLGWIKKIPKIGWLLAAGGAAIAAIGSLKS